MFPLAAANFFSPLLLAVLIGWILSVAIHEFAHGLAAHFGGDYTISDRGGLTLNPLFYIDPLGSIVLPAIVLIMGGFPLPGGATFVRTDLLRGPLWRVLVAAAGPLANFVLYFLLSWLVDPRLGWVADWQVSEWSTAQQWVGAMACLQLLATILNLLPIPPLDGFQMISPFLPEDLVHKVMTPPISTLCFFGYFMLLMSAPNFWKLVFHAMRVTNEQCGFGPGILLAYVRAFAG
jgi:Zn-dependent protease